MARNDCSRELTSVAARGRLGWSSSAISESSASRDEFSLGRCPLRRGGTWWATFPRSMTEAFVPREGGGSGGASFTAGRRLKLGEVLRTA